MLEDNSRHSMPGIALLLAVPVVVYGLEDSPFRLSTGHVASHTTL